MKRINIYTFLLLTVIPLGVWGQAAEYNMSTNWVYPTAQKFTGMDFINSATGELINNGTVWYAGNFTNHGTVSFVTEMELSPALSEFAGSTTQLISGTGTTRFYNLKFGSELLANAFSLEQNIAVARQVDFSKGIVTARQTTPQTMMNMLQLENEATCINASDNSYVDGFVSKTGSAAFCFPVGNGGFYRPLSLGATTDATNCFAARYICADPGAAGYVRTNKVKTISSVSDKEYWVVNHTTGTSNGQLTLSWDVSKTSAPVPADLQNLTVARWDGSGWVNEGNLITTGDLNTGTITANVTGYGIFTLAGINNLPPVAVNDSVNTFEELQISGNVLTNDSIFTVGKLTLTDFSLNGISYKPGTTGTLPNTGTITLAADGVFTFIPVLNYNGTLPDITYTITDVNGNTDTGMLIIHVLPLPELFKKAGNPVMNSDFSFSWIYMLTIQNDTPLTLENVQVEDNLDDVFKGKGCTYTVTDISATGGLTANGLYNGSGNIKTLIDGLSLLPNQLDSIRIEVKVDPQGQTDVVSVFNQATFKATVATGEISLKSREGNTTLIPDPTKTDIPVAQVVLPEGFSPNGDGLNDIFVIVHLPLSRIEIEVFNRNGNSVFKSLDYQNNWDGKGTGTFLGRDLIDGTYYVSFKETSVLSGVVLNKGIKSITIRR